MEYRKWVSLAGVLCIGLLGAVNVWADDSSKLGTRSANPFDQFDEIAQCEKLYQARQYKQAFPVCREAAEQGHSDGQLNLGLMYQSGQGAKQDYAAAMKWYRKAAEQGNAYAQQKWYRKAAEQGDDFAQFLLGAMYEHGQGARRRSRGSFLRRSPLLGVIPMVKV